MTPLERAARAIAALMPEGEIGWRCFVDEARAVLLAVREPSEGMANSAIDNNGVGPFTAECVWQAMIDAALDE